MFAVDSSRFLYICPVCILNSAQIVEPLVEVLCRTRKRGARGGAAKRVATPSGLRMRWRASIQGSPPGADNLSAASLRPWNPFGIHGVGASANTSSYASRINSPGFEFRRDSSTVLAAAFDAEVPAVEEEVFGGVCVAEVGVFGELQVGDPEALVTAAEGPAFVQAADAGERGFGVVGDFIVFAGHRQSRHLIHRYVIRRIQWCWCHRRFAGW